MSIFHRHEWSDWTIVSHGQVVDDIWNHIVGSYIVQDRFCRTCGKHKIKQQRTGSIRANVRLVECAQPTLRAPQKDMA